MELHIEQGPVLEALGRPAGAVTAINGQTRLSVTITGEAGHAGTVPMGLRRDALAVAAEGVLAVERECDENDDVVGTVGILRVTPGAINVIPGEVTFTVDIRGKDDVDRRNVVAEVSRAVREAAEQRNCFTQISVLHEAVSAPCVERMIKIIERAIATVGFEPCRMPSGAGHDAAAMAEFCDVGMIFLRSERGVSHNPAERTSEEDVTAGINIMMKVLDEMEGY